MLAAAIFLLLECTASILQISFRRLMFQASPATASVVAHIAVLRQLPDLRRLHIEGNIRRERFRIIITMKYEVRAEARNRAPASSCASGKSCASTQSLEHRAHSVKSPVYVPVQMNNLNKITGMSLREIAVTSPGCSADSPHGIVHQLGRSSRTSPDRLQT